MREKQPESAKGETNCPKRRQNELDGTKTATKDLKGPELSKK